MHLLETIGNTPLIELKNTTVSSKVRLLFKYERGTPGGSIKDRPALDWHGHRAMLQSRISTLCIRSLMRRLL